jgi:hypothetical protein
MPEHATDYWSEPTPPEIHSADTVESADLRFMLDYWRELKGERRWPSRAELSPQRMKRCLRVIHIYDILEGCVDFRARLVGTGVYPRLEQDQTGRLISEHPDPGVRLRFGLLLRQVCATGQPARSVSLRVTGARLHDARTEGLWLPLGTGDRIENILGVSSVTFVPPSTGRGAH